MSRKLLLIFAFVLLLIGGTWSIDTHPKLPTQRPQSASTLTGVLHLQGLELTSWQKSSPILKEEPTLHQYLFPAITPWSVSKSLNIVASTTTSTPAPTSMVATPPPMAVSYSPVAPVSTPVTTPAVISPNVIPAAVPPSAPSVGDTNDIIPPEWMATAICEEGGRNDPYAGYFGILEWHGYDGYAEAGDAPASVQIQWEYSVGQTTPPDANTSSCHGY